MSLVLEEKEKFITECESWLGTKWMHSVALKGYGVDCVHLIMSVAKNMGWVSKDYKIFPYAKDWLFHCDESALVNELEKYCMTVQKEDLEIGDILLYKFGKCISHSAWYIGNNKGIHSYVRRGVVIFNLDDKGLKERFVKAMRIRR